VQDFTGAKLLESSTKPNSFIRFMFSSIRFLRISSYPTGLSSSATPIVPVPKLPTPRPRKQNLDENLKVKIANKLYIPSHPNLSSSTNNTHPVRTAATNQRGTWHVSGKVRPWVAKEHCLFG
jgi:hypothetical protein